MYDDDMMYEQGMGPEIEEPGEATEAGMGYGEDEGPMHEMSERMGLGRQYGRAEYGEGRESEVEGPAGEPPQESGYGIANYGTGMGDDDYEDEGESGMPLPPGARMDLIMRADDDSDEESPLGYEVYGYNSDDDDDESTCCIVQSHGGGEQTMVIIPMALLKMMHSECCRWEESCGYGSY